VPEVRERQAHDPAFCFRGAGKRQEILQRVFFRVIRGRLLRRRLRLRPELASRA